MISKSEKITQELPLDKEMGTDRDIDIEPFVDSNLVGSNPANQDNSDKITPLNVKRLPSATVMSQERVKDMLNNKMHRMLRQTGNLRELREKKLELKQKRSELIYGCKDMKRKLL